MPSRYFLSQPR